MTRTKTGMTTVVDAEMNALEYLEAVWEACEHRRNVPDPLLVSDAALRAIADHAKGDLPQDAIDAVAKELRRRDPAANVLLAVAVLILLGVTGMAIGLILLLP